MKFFCINPVRYLTRDSFKVDDTHLLLPHLVATRKHYKINARKIKGTKILDNGFFELGKPYNIHSLILKAHCIKADTVVIPDIMYSPNSDSLLGSRAELIQANGFRTIGVVAGKNLHDSIEMFKLLNRKSYIDIIAVPGQLLKKRINMSRYDFLKVIDNECHNKKSVHLFGMEDICELDYHKEFSFVKSIDSTMPFKLGYFTIKLPIPCRLDISRPNYYFDINTLNHRQKEAINYNYNWIRRRLNGDI